MNVYFLGEHIKKQREKLGLTQEQVCAGICEQVTLSRLENGRQTPSRTPADESRASVASMIARISSNVRPISLPLPAIVSSRTVV